MTFSIKGQYLLPELISRGSFSFVRAVFTSFNMCCPLCQILTFKQILAFNFEGVYFAPSS